MQVVTQIDQVLANNLPLYAGASHYAQDHYKRTLESLNNIYVSSENRVQEVRNATNGLRNQAFMLFSQSADDLLEYVEDKLTMKIEELEEKDKVKRVVKILSHLKDEFILTPIHKITEFNGELVQRGKALSEQYILPIFISFKATIMLQVLAERLGQLKMTYKVSKDSVTMFFTGEFDEEKILSRVGQNISSFKQLTVSFVQKGMEISISKRELFENYNQVVEKLNEIIRGVSSKSIEQWNDTKTKTLNLYHSVLNRIKEKEIEIRTEYTKEFRPLSRVAQVASDVIPQAEEEVPRAEEVAPPVQAESTLEVEQLNDQ